MDIEQLLAADFLRPDALYPSLERSVGLVAVKVATIRELGHELHHEPLRENWYHGGIRGRLGHKARKELANSAVAVVEIDPEEVRKYVEQPDAFEVSQ